MEDLNQAQGGNLQPIKWLCLKSLMEVFIDPAQHQMVSIKYFSAYQSWRPNKAARHAEYVKALKHTGVEVHLGNFKEKDKYCGLCQGTFKGHEEKESDVNFATELVADAHDNKFDIAYIVTRDSDLAGPMRHIRKRFPEKRLKVIAPQWRRHSKELFAIATHNASIKQAHLSACRMPNEVKDDQGNVVATCPQKYWI